LIGQVRAGIARHPNDPRGAALVDGPAGASSEFRALWTHHHVRAFQPSPLHLDHPQSVSEDRGQ
jgi:hypothetical protein